MPCSEGSQHENNSDFAKIMKLSGNDFVGVETANQLR